MIHENYSCKPASTVLSMALSTHAILENFRLHCVLTFRIFYLSRADAVSTRLSRGETICVLSHMHVVVPRLDTSQHTQHRRKQGKAKHLLTGAV